ncbi:EAL domain-containing protein [Intestinirhabdus alba]|jgi:EAL domain-containing protein (putative c-di-GMP-specific phosphodiesterase class I)|uniref:EAL domain-containing protein n=1 Tax=Intestinirhabdus alba TaxID=2899544 RepID=A0A6L6IN12_9ENTR|nr:EAL domain-containing protein [Intestinirhabdus alba]MTH46896.1 EAL domain-containing protein [Intestinirhabdus alba]
MNILLNDIYHSDLCFLPLRSAQRKLIGLEIIANFVSADGTVRIPTELVLPRLSPAEQYQLFEEKLAQLEKCQHFFIQHKLIAWIYLSPQVAQILINDAASVCRIRRFPFLELLINEDYPDLNKGKEEPALALLAAQFPLILANFGAGDSSTKAIFDGLFKRVVLDKNFVQRRAASPSFEPFMRAILTQVSPCCESVMIAGIDSEAMLARVSGCGFAAMQGCLWPPVPPGQVTALVQE